jgi:hypothetical protein
MSDTPNTPAAPAAAPQGDGSDHDQPQGDEQSQGKEQSVPQTKKKPPQYRKIRAGDEELTLSDEDIAREYKKWKGADSKFREAAQARQSVEQFMKALQEDPESVLSDPRLPLDRKKLAEKWLVQQIEDELKPKDPRDQKLTEMERRLKEYEEKEQAKVKEQEDKATSEARQKSMEKIGSVLREAGKLTHLSAHPESEAALIREMALYMRAATERGEKVSPQELVEHIHNSRFQQFYTLANQFEGEELLEFLGEEVVRKLRKADLARLKAGREQGQSHKNESWTPNSKSDKSERFDAHAARDRVRKMLLNK